MVVARRGNICYTAVFHEEGLPLSSDVAAPKPRRSRKSAPLPPDAAEQIAAIALARLDEDKAEDVVVIDMKGKSPLADALVIASGRSQRHVAALADHVLRALKDSGFGRVKVEGLPQADWVLIDAGDVLVHIFRPEVRAFYQIEKIWSVDAPRPATAPTT